MSRKGLTGRQGWVSNEQRRIPALAHRHRPTSQATLLVHILGGSCESGERMRLVLPLPPSANRYWRFNRGRIHRSPQADIFSTKCYWLVKQQSNKVEPLEGPVSLVAVVYFPNRRGDLDNRIKQCLDGLQGAAYADDKQVEHLEFTRAIDKGNPRVEVEVRAIDDTTPEEE